MTPDLAIRRSIRKVSHADFAAYPIWEWAIDEEVNLGNGESFVRPTSLDAVPLDPLGHYIVAANTTLSDGVILPSCVEVSTRGKKQHVEPMFVFLLDRHLDFAGVETTALLSRYTKRVNIYPVRWEMAVPMAGETRLRSGKVRRGLWERLAQFWARLRLGSGGQPLAR
ncbi:MULTISPECIES: hypothetical protein [Massilia]|uniref:Type I restriction modification DNA specificity domain-containing protein n=2 Tax=Massilia TaxID=149698 RepID=A0ABX0ME72_9BURK|nr:MULTISPECIES: hypothetical protein [Massilia]NHZ40431.1 hypothetical protein [Massilia aquatica]NHZ88176.1 hypothetical protein [Massilia mucilaginosa]